MAEKDAEIWTCHFLSRKKCGNLDFIIFNGGKRCGKLNFVIFYVGNLDLSFLMAEKDAESWTLSFFIFKFD
jgi:hypothetical protein